MPALRQYKSNDGSDGYVIAYEKGCVDVIVEALEQENELLKWAYCREIGSDSITGLDCCDNFRDWVSRLALQKEGES